MTLIAPRPATPAAPASRASRLAGLAAPGALLALGSVAVGSMVCSQGAIAHAIRLIVTLH